MNMESIREEQNDVTKYRPIGLQHLSEKLLNRAKQELNETDENIKLGLKIMKDKIQKEKLFQDKDEFLLKFLRVKKYKFQESFESYKNYLRVLDICVKKMKTSSVDIFLSIATKNVITLLPYRDANDTAIAIYKLGVYKREGLEIDDAVLQMLAVAFFLSIDPATQIGGFSLIFDAKEMIYSDAPYILPYLRWLIPMVRGFAGRFKRVDIINQPTIFGTFISLVRPIMPPKIRNRVHIHGQKVEDLLKIYPSKILPSEYGGTLDPIDNKNLIEQMRSCSNYFQTLVTEFRKVPRKGSS